MAQDARDLVEEELVVARVDLDEHPHHLRVRGPEQGQEHPLPGMGEEVRARGARLAELGRYSATPQYGKWFGSLGGRTTAGRFAGRERPPGSRRGRPWRSPTARPTRTGAPVGIGGRLGPGRLGDRARGLCGWGCRRGEGRGLRGVLVAEQPGHEQHDAGRRHEGGQQAAGDPVEERAHQWRNPTRETGRPPGGLVRCWDAGGPGPVARREHGRDAAAQSAAGAMIVPRGQHRARVGRTLPADAFLRRDRARTGRRRRGRPRAGRRRLLDRAPRPRANAGSLVDTHRPAAFANAHPHAVDADANRHARVEREPQPVSLPARREAGPRPRRARPDGARSTSRPTGGSRSGSSSPAPTARHAATSTRS